jgi:folate-dependent tRNA-U54 methylase TrmFO/GidA
MVHYQGLTGPTTLRLISTTELSHIDREKHKKVVYRLIEEYKAIKAMREEISSISDDEGSSVSALEERKLNQLARMIEIGNESLMSFYFKEVQ